MIGNKIIINKLSKKRMVSKRKNTRKPRSNKKIKRGGGGNKNSSKYNTINVKRAKKLNHYASNVINSMNSRLDKLSKQIKY